MSPRAYIQAQESALEHVVVDDRPYLPLLVANGSSETSIRQVVLQILGLPSSKENESMLVVEPISGGITNQLFRVSGLERFVEEQSPSTVSSLPDSVLVRVFGAEGLIDRHVENSLYASLAQAKLAPAYFGRFANGRIEKWCEGYRPLEVQELGHAQISQGIAKALAKLHTTFDLPIHVQEHLSNHGQSDEPEPLMWTQLEDWLQQATRHEATATTTFDSHNVQRIDALQLSRFDTELEWLRTSVIPTDAATAFCHNDLLAANILFDDTSSNIQLIDFEYGGINYCAFDVANHFNEFAGGTDTGIPNYEWFPRRDQQVTFCRTYLHEARSTDSAVVTEQQVDELLEHVQAFCLANHVYWGLWAVHQAATEGCEDFDYLLYATNRLNQYWVCKRDWQEATASES